MRALGSTEYSLDLGSELVVAVYRSVNAQRPRLSGRILSVTENFADIDKHVLDTNGIQIFSNKVTAIALGYGIVIQFRQNTLIYKDFACIQATLRNRIHISCKPFHSRFRQHLSDLV